MTCNHPHAESQLASFEENVTKYGETRLHVPIKLFVGADDEDARQFAYVLADHARVRPVRRGKLVMMYLRAKS